MADKKSASKNSWGLTTASLVALSMAIGAGAAQAQETEEEIVVTGFRGSLAAAVDIKRNAVGSVDAIVAEDIADFPDLNLSESIQRIPGVAITRDAGEGRQITVRGLGPQFTRVRINGMEALTTTGSTDATGGNNRDRSFDFNIFASELFNSIVVRKTAAAQIEEGSLGATVDLRTALPFDYQGFNLVASAQAQYNDLSESTDPRLAFMISNRWDLSGGGRIGGLFSVAYSSRESREEGASTVRWAPFGSITPANNLSTVPTADLNAAFRPRLPRFDVYEHEQERLGLTAALQYSPSRDTTFTLSALHSNFEGTRYETFLQSNLTVGVGGIRVNDAVIDGNSITYAELDNVVIRSELRHDELQTEFNQITFEADHRFTDRLSGRAVLGWSESDHVNPIQTTLLFRAGGPSGLVNGYSYDFRNSTSPTFGFGFDLTNPANWGLEEIRLRPQTTYNSYTTFGGDLTFDINEVFTLHGGINWRNYKFKTSERRRWNGTANSTANIEGTRPGFTTATPIADYSNLITYNGVSWLIPDIDAAAAEWDLYDESVFLMSPLGQLAANRGVIEEVLGAYAQLDWTTDLGPVGFRGNFGVRWVETEQTSSGRSIIAGADALTTVTHSYDDILPSLNLVFEPVQDFLIRFSASQVMSRAGLGSLNPNPAVSVSGSNRTITAGNPQLDPIRADAYDLSAEWYFSEGGLLSFALFHREIESFVQTVRETAPFTGNPFGLPDSVGIAACGSQYTATPRTCDVINDPNFLWGFNVPQNSPGGPVSGFEISLQLPMTFLPGPLSNTGLLANYTRVESDIDYLNATGVVTYSGQLTNQSDESYNITLYYEDDRFSARISGAYRSSFPTNLPGRDSNDTEETGDSFNVDVSARWNVTDHLALTLEGINLTNEAREDYLTPDNRLSFYHEYGRSFILGARYSF